MDRSRSLRIHQRYRGCSVCMEEYRVQVRNTPMIVTNNGPQFDSRVYRNFYSKLKIKNLYSTPWYPQINGHTEAFNKTVISVLKKRLHSAKGKWVDELLGVLWAYKTTSWKPTRVSPFSHTYGMEAIIPIEIGMPTVRK